jgi:hypothetical protein
MSRQSVPALSIAIVEDNQLRFQRGYEMADVENFVLLSARRAIDFTIQRFSFG